MQYEVNRYNSLLDKPKDLEQSLPTSWEPLVHVGQAYVEAGRSQESKDYHREHHDFVAGCKEYNCVQTTI